jgi:hypothetical protein
MKSPQTQLRCCSVRTVELFRVVSMAELVELQRQRVFQVVEGHMEVKSFWARRDDAHRFARQLERIDESPNVVVSVVLRDADARRLTRIRADSRRACVVERDDLAWFNSCIVDLLLPSPSAPHV